MRIIIGSGADNAHWPDPDGGVPGADRPRLERSTRQNDGQRTSSAFSCVWSVIKIR